MVWRGLLDIMTEAGYMMPIIRVIKFKTEVKTKVKTQI